MRLIDAEALENEILLRVPLTELQVNSIKFVINKAPAIEAKPVVHAHWENGECTNCKAFITDKNALLTPYCPFCGAQMDEKEGE